MASGNSRSHQRPLSVRDGVFPFLPVADCYDICSKSVFCSILSKALLSMGTDSIPCVHFTTDDSTTECGKLPPLQPFSRVLLSISQLLTAIRRLRGSPSCRSTPPSISQLRQGIEVGLAHMLWDRSLPLAHKGGTKRTVTGCTPSPLDRSLFRSP